MSEVKKETAAKKASAKKEVTKEASAKKEAAKKTPAKKPAAKKASKSKVVAKAEMFDVVRSPIITEKSQIGVEFNKITFQVAPDSNKKQIKAAVEALFEAKVEKVNIINVKGKTKRFRGTLGKRKDVKKAVVTLAEGENIDVVAAA